MTKTKKTPLLGWIICTIAAIFYCYEYLLRIEPSVMVPELMQAFQANATELGILSAFFYFIYTPMQIVVGLLLDLYGPRRILTLAIITCALGSYIFSIADLLFVAAIGRLLIGFGSAFAFVSVLKLAATWLPKRFFALFVGLATALGMFGAMFGVVILSSLVNDIGWKQTMNIGTIIGIVLVPLIWLIIHDKPSEISSHHKVKEKKKTRSRYYVTFVGFIKILKNPQMWLNGFIACSMYLSLSLFAELWCIPFLTSAYDLPDDKAAMACSMIYLGWLVGGPLIGYISDVTYSRKIPILLGCLFSAILVGFIIYLPQMNIKILCLALFLFGVFSSAEILCFAVGTENSPKHLVATASAFTNCTLMLGGVTFQPLIGKILDTVWTGEMLGEMRAYSTENYQLALIVLPIALLIGFILTFWLRETCKDTCDKKVTDEKLMVFK